MVPDERRALTPLAQLEGRVDISALDAHVRVAIRRLEDGTLEISAPGLLIRVNEEVGAYHVDDESIVVALGSPLIEGHRASVAQLARMSDRRQIGGRYALAVIDRLRRTVRLQTDRFGVLPICWAQAGSRVSFADRADCVATSDTPSLDTQGIFDYAYFHVIPAPRTAYCGVSRLEPATQLLFSASGAACTPSWRPQFSSERRGAFSDLSTRFRDTIRDSVSFESGEPAVGCYLSGGTDSSTVAGMLKLVTGQANTFSIGFDEPGYDEMAYARIAARHFGTEHHEHYVTPAEVADAVPKVAAHYDQPFGNSSAVPAFICACLAKSTGIRKLLAGDGGDELFGGNMRYAKQKALEVWWSLPGALRNAAAPTFANELARRLPLAKKVASYIAQARVPMPARLEAYNLLSRFGPATVFEADFLEQIDVRSPAALQSDVYSRNAAAPFVDRMLAYDWRFTLTDNDLPKVCGTTRLAGVNVGFPLLADTLVDFSMMLGPRDKVHGLRLRHFFKQSLAEFLPPEIIAKKKHGFGMPVGRWLVSNPALRELAHDSLSALAGRRLVRSAFVDELLSRRLEEHAGYYGEMIWVLMQLEQWLLARFPTWRLG